MRANKEICHRSEGRITREAGEQKEIYGQYCDLAEVCTYVNLKQSQGK